MRRVAGWPPLRALGLRSKSLPGRGIRPPRPARLSAFARDPLAARSGKAISLAPRGVDKAVVLERPWPLAVARLQMGDVAVAIVIVPT